jgi:hypothetical protein
MAATRLPRVETERDFVVLKRRISTTVAGPLKVHKIEIFFGFDFEICIISLLVM